MIEKLKDYNLTIVNKKGERYFNQRNIIAVEMIETKDFYYKVDQIVEIAEIKYKYKQELLKKMKIVVNNIGDYLDLDQWRLIFNNSSLINIVLDVEVDIEKFEERPELEFYGFYEMNSERIFLLTFEDEIKYDSEYLVMMNTYFNLNFPYSAQGTNEVEF
jgi:hypothetical protein